MYTFKKDHLKFKAGQQVESHPNLDYLVRMGVIELTEETHLEPEKVQLPDFANVKSKPVKKPKKVK